MPVPVTPETPGVKVGDEVRVFDINARRRGQPHGGWVGTVVKVGRILAHVEYQGRTQTFELSTGYRNDNYRHQHFETLEQVDVNARCKTAVDVLRERGVELSNRRSFTLEQIEALAEVVKTWTEEA